MGAFACLLYAFDGINSTIAKDHSSRILGLFTAMVQSLGIATLMRYAAIAAVATPARSLARSPETPPHVRSRAASFPLPFRSAYITGVAASNAPYDDRATMS